MWQETRDPLAMPRNCTERGENQMSPSCTMCRAAVTADRQLGLLLEDVMCAHCLAFSKGHYGRDAKGFDI